MIDTGLTLADLADREPIKCPVCTYPGHVYQVDERGSLIYHLGRIFPCRTREALEHDHPQ